jgi:predicted membrane protein
MKPECLVLIALTCIVLVGVVGIPFGDPRFIPIAVLLELLFIGLVVLVSKGYTRPLYICVILASLIIIGNSITTAHIHRMMMTFAKPVNTIVLIIGGYVLQALLIYASVIAIMDKRRRRRRTLTSSSSGNSMGWYTTTGVKRS